MKKNILVLTLALSILWCTTPTELFAGVVVFEDNFDDNNTVGWTFFHNSNVGGTYQSAGPGSFWDASTGALVHNDPVMYTGNTEFALIDGIITPKQFTMEADITVLGSKEGANWGHVGFVWNATWDNSGYASFNTSYLRTHQDKVTNWSTLAPPGSSLGERYLDTPGAINNQTYHLAITVDAIVREMTVTMGAYTTTFSGTAFDEINQSTSGGIGLISWHDNIRFDNVRLSTPVPLPGAVWLLGAGMAGLIGIRQKRQNLLSA